MSQYLKWYQKGGCYFFTVVTFQRKKILIQYIDRLREAFRYGMNKLPYSLDAIVILPDHLH